MAMHFRASPFAFFSYVVGGRLLNIFTEFYLMEGHEGMDNMTVDSPKWIGAWWLGFLLILALSYLCAILLVRNICKKNNLQKNLEGWLTKRDLVSVSFPGPPSYLARHPPQEGGGCLSFWRRLH